MPFVSDVITSSEILAILKHYFKRSLKAAEVAYRIQDMERYERISDHIAKASLIISKLPETQYLWWHLKQKAQLIYIDDDDDDDGDDDGGGSGSDFNGVLVCLLK